MPVYSESGNSGGGSGSGGNYNPRIEEMQSLNYTDNGTFAEVDIPEDYLENSVHVTLNGLDLVPGIEWEELGNNRIRINISNLENDDQVLIGWSSTS